MIIITFVVYVRNDLIIQSLLTNHFTNPVKDICIRGVLSPA